MQPCCALTTIDNPFNPFEDFDQWFLFDIDKGYQCCERVAKFAKTNAKMSQNEINIEVERAINEIIKYDFTNTFTKVYAKVDESALDDEILDEFDEKLV